MPHLDKFPDLEVALHMMAEAEDAINKASGKGLSENIVAYMQGKLALTLLQSARKKYGLEDQ